MAPRRSKRTASSAPAEDAKQPENTEQKGYAGTGDYATGAAPSDPAQASDERIREDRRKQRNT